MATSELVIDGWQVRALGPQTWDAFEGLAARHNGVFGGCWCVFFHCHPEPVGLKELGNKEFKHQRVLRDEAHAALVFDGDEAIAWAEFGPPEELANIHHRRQWEAEVHERPDYRITCLFVDRRYRRTGMAAVAVRGAMALIAAQGGGLVESYPHDLAPGQKKSASFLYNATRTMYERLGFRYLRPKGQGNCTMSIVIEPSPAAQPAAVRGG